MIRKLISILAVGTAVVSTGLIGASSAAADTPVNCSHYPDGTLKPGCFALNLSPARVVTPALAAGQTFTQVFTLVDKGNVNYTVDVVAVDYAQSVKGDFDLSGTAPGAAAAWVHTTPATIEMGGTHPRVAQVTVTVTPSVTASPGDHNLGVVFRAKAPASAANPGIHLQQQVAAQMPILIPGTLTHGVALNDLKTETKHSLFGIHLPGTWTSSSFTVRNTGSVHQDFYSADDISATVSGWGAPSATLTAPKFTVLRDSSRTITAPWANPPTHCWCKVTWTAHMSQLAALTSDPTNAAATWSAVPGAQSYVVSRGGTTVSADLPATTLSWTDPHPIDGATYAVRAITATAVATTTYHALPIPQLAIALIALVLILGGVTRSVSRFLKRDARRAAEREKIRAQVLEELRAKDKSLAGSK